MNKIIARTEVSTWWILFGASLLAVALGTWGSNLYLVAQAKPAPIADCVYRAIQLFGLNLYDPGPLPWQLEVARWMAPLVTLVSLVTAFSGVLHGHLLSWRLSKAKNHTVIAGTNWPTDIKAEGVGSIVYVQTNGDTQPHCDSNGNLLLKARNIQEAVSRCKMHRSAVVAVEVNSVADGISWITAMQESCLQHRRLSKNLCLVSDELNIASSLKSLSHLAEPQLRVRVIDMTQVLFERCSGWVAEALTTDLAGRSTATVRLAGDPDYNLEIARQLARQLTLLPDFKLRVEVCIPIGAAAQEAALKMLSLAAPHISYQQVSVGLCDVADLGEVKADMFIYSSKNADDLLQKYESLSRILHASNAPKLAITVHGSWHASHAITSLLGNATNGKITFVCGDAFRELVNTIQPHSSLECLAKQVHAGYLTSVQYPNSPASKPWDSLQERYRESSRLQAQSFVFKLASLGYTPESAMASLDAVRAEIESKMEDLSEAEHNRWSAEKKLLGWTHGERRDDVAKLHPCLIAYAALPDAEKEKDRVMWRQLIQFIQNAPQHSNRTASNL